MSLSLWNPSSVPSVPLSRFSRLWGRTLSVAGKTALGGFLVCFLTGCASPLWRSPSSRTSPLFHKQNFRTLDMGLYWFGSQTRCARGKGDGKQKYYDPSRPSILYVHGWQPGATGRRMREDFLFHHAGGPRGDVTRSWRKKGWNLGVMYWNQLSDEPLVEHAEAKIWTTRGPKQMRWKTLHQGYSSGKELRNPVGEQLAAVYLRMLKKQTGPVRLVGHSLGSQAVLAMMKSLLTSVNEGEISATRLPRRVALLDPYFSKGKKHWLGRKSTAEYSLPTVRELVRRGILLELYYTSGVVNHPLFGDPNPALAKFSAVSVLRPHFFHGFDFTRRHIMARWYYFWSMSFPQPAVRGVHRKGLSAVATDEDVRWWMKASFKTVQRSGLHTLTLRDDVMSLVRK